MQWRTGQETILSLLCLKWAFGKGIFVVKIKKKQKQLNIYPKKKVDTKAFSEKRLRRLFAVVNEGQNSRQQQLLGMRMRQNKNMFLPIWESNCVSCITSRETNHNTHAQLQFPCRNAHHWLVPPCSFKVVWTLLLLVPWECSCRLPTVFTPVYGAICNFDETKDLR